MTYKYPFADVPVAEGIRSGAKVGWLYYKTLAEAEAAVPGIKREAARKASQGYDFGYCMPGSIHKLPDTALGELAPFAGMYEVCIP